MMKRKESIGSFFFHQGVETKILRYNWSHQQLKKERQMKPIYTHKTKDGRPARIISNHIINEKYPIGVAILDDDCERLHLYTTNLKYYVEGDSQMDLIGCSPWDDVAVDTKVLVRDDERDNWVPNHFSHYHDGMVYTFQSGRTSWSLKNNADPKSYNTSAWSYAKLAE